MLASSASLTAPHASLLRGAGALVLVETSAWGQPGSALLEALRAELRALGATLLVLSEEGPFHFRPDQDMQPVAHAAGVTAGAVEELRRLVGAPRHESRLTLSVLEESGELRLRLSRDVDAGVPESLLEALRLASEQALEPARDRSLTRRELVVSSLVGALTLVLGQGCKPQQRQRAGAARAAPPASARELPIVLNVNGQRHELRVEPRVSLLDALRERLAQSGTKKGCDHGQCGACTVLIDDRRVLACLTLAALARDKRITTIEGLAQAEALHPLQEAFIEEDALQCGYCTPGQIMSGLGLLKEGRARSDDEVREHMSGNLCRCGAYTNIVRAIQRARKDVPA